MRLDEVEVGTVYVVNDSNPDMGRYVGRLVKVAEITDKSHLPTYRNFPVSAWPVDPPDNEMVGAWLLAPSELSPLPPEGE